MTVAFPTAIPVRFTVFNVAPVGALAPRLPSAIVSLKVVVVLLLIVVSSFSVEPPASVRYTFRAVVPPGPVEMLVSATVLTVAVLLLGASAPSDTSVVLSV